MLNVLCVNAYNYLGRGDEYVRRLRAGVERNLSVPFEFHVLTEHSIPSGLTGWWSKLAMFEPGRFTGRCLFFDLDTIITGSLDDIAGYQGSFAGLSDFYHPNMLASGVMAWRSGAADHIWTKWDQADRPSFHPGGDGSWINAMMPDADRLQDLFPGQIVSFKAHCANGAPKGARVVCFHGLPRPHVLRDLLEN